MSRPVGIPRRDENERSAGASEIIKGLFRRIGASGKTYERVGAEAGLDKKTLTSWRRNGKFPQLNYVMRCLLVLEHSLVIVRQEGGSKDAPESSPKDGSRRIEPPRGEDDEWSAGANAILNMIYHYANESPKSYTRIEREAKLTVKALDRWSDEGVFPRLDSVMRCLRVLGYSLVIMRQEEGSAFEHPGYFAMLDRREEVRCENAGLPPTTVFETPEWKEANAYGDWFEPTPEEIATETRHQRLNSDVFSAARLATLSQGEHIVLIANSKRFSEERRRRAEAIDKRKSEKRRKTFAEMHRKRKGKAQPSCKAKASAKMARMRERIARKEVALPAQ